MNPTIPVLQVNRRIQEALSILSEINVPREQQNERSALCLLALADIKKPTKWRDASNPPRRINEMMEWFKENYGKNYAPNTRETVRRQTMHQFIQLGLVVENPDDPTRPINSPKWCYQLTDEALLLLKSYGTKDWGNRKTNFITEAKNLLRPRHRDLPVIPVRFPDGREIELSAGGQNELIKAIIEEFCPRFTPNGLVAYIGDAGGGIIAHANDLFTEMRINLDLHGKMPDVVVYYEKKEWLVLIEAVTSHGPVDLLRRNELKAIFAPSGKGLVFVTAFPKRMPEYFSKISWETEVWLASDPDHLIHFNGEKFLGPYDE